MKPRGKLLLISGLLASGLTIAAPAASADTLTCASLSEMRIVINIAVPRQWTRTGVYNTVDVPGRRVLSYTYPHPTRGMKWQYEMRDYARCAGGRTYAIAFRRTWTDGHPSSAWTATLCHCDY